MLKLATKLRPEPAAFETAYRAGFRHVELYLDENVLAGWQGALRQAHYFPNSYVPHFPNRLDLGPATLEQAVGLYRGLGSRCMVIHPAMFDQFHEALRRREPGLQLAVENGRLDRDGFALWAERFAALALDVEHLWKYTLGDAPLEELLAALRGFLARHGAKLRHVHLPGYQPGCAEHRPMYCSRDMVLAVWAALADFGFDGLVVSEVATGFQNYHDLHMDVLLFERWREKHDPRHPGRARGGA